MSSGRAAAAHAHLEIIRGRLASTGVPGSELIRYVVLAYIYGLEVDEIARTIKTDVEFVRWMLLVGA